MDLKGLKGLADVGLGLGDFGLRTAGLELFGAKDGE